MGFFGKQSKAREKVPNIDFGQTSFVELQNELSHRSPNAQLCSAETEEIRPLFSKLFQDGGANCIEGPKDVSSDGSVVAASAGDSSAFEEKPRKRTSETASRCSGNTANPQDAIGREPSHHAVDWGPPALTWSESRRMRSDHPQRPESANFALTSSREVDLQTLQSRSKSDHPQRVEAAGSLASAPGREVEFQTLQSRSRSDYPQRIESGNIASAPSREGDFRALQSRSRSDHPQRMEAGSLASAPSREVDCQSLQSRSRSDHPQRVEASAPSREVDFQTLQSRSRPDHPQRIESGSLASTPSRDMDTQVSRSTSQKEQSRLSLPSPQPNAFRGMSRKESLSQVLSPVSPDKINESPRRHSTKSATDDDSRKGLHTLRSPREQKTGEGTHTPPQRDHRLRRTNSIARGAQLAPLKRIHSLRRPRSASENGVVCSPKSAASASPKQDVPENEIAKSEDQRDSHQVNSPIKLSSLMASTLTRRPSMRVKASSPRKGTVESPKGKISDTVRDSTPQQKLEPRCPTATSAPVDEAELTSISDRPASASKQIPQVDPSGSTTEKVGADHMSKEGTKGPSRREFTTGGGGRERGSTTPSGRSKSAPRIRPREQNVPPVWEKVDNDDFSDVTMFGLEAATQRDFIGPNLALNNTPNGSAMSNNNAEISLISDVKAKQSLTNSSRRTGPYGERREAPAALFGAQSKPNANKRPPPLLTQEAPVAAPPASSGSTSPQADVFRSNGDFSTGGFLITAEGVVGKPDKATKLDSDDGPTTGVPQSMSSMVIVGSLAEFRKGPTLGAGAAGRVYLAIHEPSGRSMAIKVVNVYDEAKRNQLLKELDTLVSYASRFLVRFHGAFYDGTGAVHIALEFMDGGCLSSTIQNFGAIPERVTQMIAVDCLRALRFLHRHNVIHRDLKTANILLSRRLLCAKVSDFGLARDLNEGVSKVDTFVGTLAYMSPERLQGGKYSSAADIWALGISIAECLIGRYPFDRPQSYFDYIDASMCKDMLGKRGADGKALSAAVVEFVRLCTHSDPQGRPTAAQLLAHPWIANTKRDVTLFRQWMDELAAAKSRSEKNVKSDQSVRAFLASAR